jgi:hypothetical protein
VLYQIVAVGQNTNSYKFALWRALAHLAPVKSVISKRDLAPLFLEYYWPLQLQYHVRQGTDPDKDPIVMRRVRELLAGGTIEQGEALKEIGDLLDQLHQKDFELLIELIFSSSGCAPRARLQSMWFESNREAGDKILQILLETFRTFCRLTRSPN